MNLGVLFSTMVFIILCFPLFYSPVSMVAILMSMSLGVVGILSLFSSFWYSYILFLIYVGGLLVLFIYICLVSSNIPLMISVEGLIFVVSFSLISSIFGVWGKPLMFLGQSSYSSGSSLVEGSNLSIFIFLVVLLLAMLLVVVRVSGAGASIVVNEKS